MLLDGELKINTLVSLVESFGDKRLVEYMGEREGDF